MNAAPANGLLVNTVRVNGLRLMSVRVRPGPSCRTRSRASPRLPPDELPVTSWSVPAGR
ncbi:hypothetical protein [Nonomuraea sp. NPDC049709]|uniref:hypothetical protein n=1 Tax=Nonomuraea sp. NPDC049709 TaxID=3154736 RepID=UPI003446314F